MTKATKAAPTDPLTDLLTRWRSVCVARGEGAGLDDLEHMLRELPVEMATARLTEALRRLGGSAS